MVALSGFVLSGCGDDDGGNLFNQPDAGDASAIPDHASDAGSDGGSTSDVSASDRVQPPPDVAVGDVTSGDSAPDVRTAVDASDTGTGVTDAGPDATDTGSAPTDAGADAIETGPDAADAGPDATDTGSAPTDAIETEPDAADAGVEASDAADASSDADAEVDASDAGCDDGDRCTVDSQLAGGSCTHVAVVCVAFDECHVAGTCNPSSGCSNPAADDGATCTQAQGGRCSAGTCVGTFLVTRVGTGGAALTSAATAAFIERRYLDSVGAIVPGTGNGTLSMPTAVNGSDQRFVLSGSASSEGALSLSADGKYVLLAGYDADLGTAGVGSSASATVNRIVGRIAPNGTVDTSTRLDAAFSGNNVRGATSTNGTNIWVSGNGMGNGVYNIAFGTIGGLGILASPANTRIIHVFGGQLYGSSDRNNFSNVFTIGTGTPMAAATATPLPGFPSGTGPSPFSYVLIDTDGAGGFDTLYVADDRTIAAGGGIQKWTLTIPDGGTATWVLTTTFDTSLISSAGVRGLAGVKTSSGVVLVATTSDASGNKIFYFLDDGGSPTPSLISTAATNTIYRGVALAP